MISMDAIQPVNETNLPEKITEKAEVKDKLEGEKDVETLEETVKLLNKTSIVYDRGLNFAIHEETNRIMVRVIDMETEEVIREVPKEEILDLIAEIYQLSGISFNKVA
ncbi:MAG: flagellar protein FlaG [bacterium]|nr:flagellar protein FlaG [bacterium]